MKSPLPVSSSKRKFTLEGINTALHGSETSQRTFAVKSSLSKTSVPSSGGLGGTVFAPMFQDLLYNNIAAYQIPKNKKAHNKLMSQIYHFDPIAGPAIDLYADFPWSAFDISGIEDPRRKQYQCTITTQ